MAKYNVEFECGHEEQVELFGKYKERERRIEYYKTCKCSTCRAAEYAKKMQNEGYEEVEMHYSEYKNKYSDCKTKKDSYNSNTKTIIVFVKKNI